MPREAMLSGHCAFEIGKVRLWESKARVGASHHGEPSKEIWLLL